MNELLMEMEIESHDIFLKKIEVPYKYRAKSKRFKAAKQALAKAEKFFCNKAR